MAHEYEFEGKNVDQALEAASNALQKPVEQLEYDVVSYGSSGIFGLVGAKKAKIRIRNGQGSRRTATPRQKAKDLVRDAFQLAEEPQAKAQPEPAPAPAAAAAAVPEPTPENLDKALRIGEEALRRIVDFITDDAKISTETNDQRILFKVEGGNSGMLIGKRGQTLEAIQYLVEKIVNKQNDQRVRVLVDVEGYLKTRKTNLQNMAERMAEKAQRTKKPATIGQMNAYDRRTVHLHLKSNPAVRTQSVGEGYYRKLIIFPKKRQRNRKSG
jgi:spoIIIJ-associated protein